MPIILLPAILGPERPRQLYGCLACLALSAGNPHARKIPRFRGGEVFGFFTWWTFRPRKKKIIFGPPPPQILQFAADTLRHLGPSRPPPHPPSGIFSKGRSPPPPAPRTPLPPPRAGRNKKYPERPPSSELQKFRNGVGGQTRLARRSPSIRERQVPL